MARYNSFIYNTSVLYGDTSGTTYGIEPFEVRAINYDNIVVSWQQPVNVPVTSPYTRFRIVRSHTHPPETQEDGIIIVDVEAPFNSGLTRVIDGVSREGTASKTVYFTDHRESVPFSTINTRAIAPGRIIYYAAWILRTDGGNTLWYRAGVAQTLLAKSHDTLLANTDDELLNSTSRTRTRTTHEKMMELLPRVYTTASQSPLDVVDEGSDLYLFMQGLAYSYDEAMTYADLLLPNHTAENFSKEIVDSKAYELALMPDSQGSLKTQRALVRESRYIYTRKGTALALGTLIEAMTGYNASIIDFTNYMANQQDSTFRGGIGSWVAGAGVTLTADFAEAPPVPEDFDGDLSNAATSSEYALDRSYCGKVVTTGSSQVISNGVTAPTTLGVPVRASTKYRFSFYAKRLSSSANITPTITWYDYNGTVIGTPAASTAVSATTSWAKKTTDLTSPAGAVYASISLSFASAGTYYLDAVMFSPRYTVTAASASGGIVTYTSTNSLVSGQRVSISGLSTAAFNLTNVFVEDATATGFTVRNPATGTAVSGATANCDHPYEEARVANVRVSANKVNYIYNPSFEASSTGWTATSSSRPTDSPLGLVGGTKCLQATLSSGNPINTTTTGGVSYGGALLAGKWYTFSIYAKSTGSTVNASVYLKATSGANSVQTPANPTAAYATAITSSWARYSVTLFVPSSYTNITLEAGIVGTTGTIRVDAAQLEPSYLPTDYFDGNYIIGGAEWEGGNANIHNAISYLYVNKPFRFPRLVEEMKMYLPSNTPYTVETVEGVEFSGFSS